MTVYSIRSGILSQCMEFLEHRSDVVMFWGFSNSTGESILNSLEAVYLGEVYVQEERVTASAQLLTMPGITTSATDTVRRYNHRTMPGITTTATEFYQEAHSHIRGFG